VGLELYARIEPLLGFEEQKRRLYEIFLEKLKELGAKNILDVGCGSGVFMELARSEGFVITGIDLSHTMVEEAKKKGLEAYCVDVCGFDGKFDAVTAVFDVINYLPPAQLGKFMECVARLVADGGYFLCDINTLYGFEEVAQGSLVIDKESRFVAIDAEFSQKKLFTDIYLFERTDNCYKKYTDRIVQYYHEVSALKGYGLKLEDIDFIELYADRPDKALLTFVRE